MRKSSSLRIFIFDYELDVQEAGLWRYIGGHVAMLQAGSPEEADDLFLEQINASKYRLADQKYSWNEVPRGKGMTTLCR